MEKKERYKAYEWAYLEIGKKHNAICLQLVKYLERVFYSQYVSLNHVEECFPELFLFQPQWARDGNTWFKESEGDDMKEKKAQQGRLTILAFCMAITS